MRFVLISLLALAAMAATLSLGRWQLSRAAQKEALQASILQQGARPPLDASVVQPSAPAGAAAPAAGPVGAADPLLDRNLVLQGVWLPQHVVYLDNRQMDSHQGFYVLMPLQLGQDGPVVLVQRGWVPRDFNDRERLPPLVTPPGPVQVTGRIAPGPARLFELAPAAHTPTQASPGGAATPPGGRIRQNLVLSDYRAETGLALWDHLLLQTDAAADGLLRHWPIPTFGVEKHYGYAFQWFGLSALIAVLYVWFQLVPQLRAPARPV